MRPLSYAQLNRIVESESIDVTDTREKETGTEITRDDMERTGSWDLWQALRWTSGIMLSDGGARGESSFNIRGFDSSSIPLIVDGISATNPFNGKGDSGSLLTGDLESVIIQKGYSSMLLGANGMGGAILLTSSKPKKAFEGYFKNTIETDSGFKFASANSIASLGSKLEKFYFKTTFQYRGIDHFKLSESFSPPAGSIQQEGNRLFSKRDDIKGTIIMGTTPVKDIDIWVKYVYENSWRGMNPPEVSPVYSLWGWDYWLHHGVSLNGKYERNKLNISFLAFYDKYDNSMSQYASIRHMEARRPHTVSVYDEYDAGFRINAAYDIHSQHTLRGAFSYRQDDHTGIRNEKSDIHVRENKLSLGLEYEYKPLKNLRLIAGGGFDSLLSEYYSSKDNLFAEFMGVSSYVVDVQDRWLLAAQAGIFYDFIDKNELRLTYARRNQFPTMSDRYSTRFNDFMPNPNLKPETADHVELGYKGALFDTLFINAALYYSHVSDKMATIRVPNPVSPSSSVDYVMNLDAASFYGFEFAANLYVFQYLELGFNFSVNEFIADKSILKMETMTYFPEFLVNAYAKINPCDYISIMPAVEYSSERYVDLYGITSLEPYVLAHIYITFNISDNFKLDMSVKNIFDENYEFRSGYPQAGRTYSISVTASF